VAADTVIGEAELPRGYLLVEMEQELGRAGRKARAVMLKQVGEHVLEGEVIARTGGLVQKEYTSPVDGEIADMRDSRVLIEVAPEPVEAIALYPGKVVSVMARVGVVIESSGALVQGDLGIGPALRATLHCPVPSGDLPLLAGQITEEHVGGILIGGRTLDAAALDQAVAAQVRGVIVASLHSSLLAPIRESGLSLIVTEGLGDVAMPERTFDLLCEHVDQEVTFAPTHEGTAAPTVLAGHKPELFGYARESDLPDAEAAQPTLAVQGAPFLAGTRVRVLRAPHQYAEGRIVSLPEVPQRLASGLTVWGAEVDLDSGERVFFPLQNLESIR
jgi:hypothetical protein